MGALAGLMIPIFGIVFGVLFVGAIIITPLVLRSQERMRLLSTLRQLHEDGKELTPEMLEALRPDDAFSRIPRTPGSDLRRGLILIAVALGLVVLSFSLGAEIHGGERFEPLWPVFGSAAFPGFIGLAFLFMAWFKLNNR